MLSDIVENTTIKMDYKVHLKSQYVTNKISELANMPLEVGFLYGGTYTQKVGPKHEINISDFYLPTKQRISPASFDFEQTTDNPFIHPKRIVGVGHSHANMDVFHSSRDYQKFKAFTAIEGISFTDYKPKRRVKKQTLREHLKTYVSLKKEEPLQVLTSFVYNMKSKVKNALMTFSDSQIFTINENQSIQYYNKNTTLTIDEKNELDRQIHQILKYNKRKRKE